MSARTFDARGRFGPEHGPAIVEALRLHGGLFVINTPLRTVEAVAQALPSLGFPASERFEEGGRTSPEVQTKWVAPGLRHMDHYPPELMLLANNEVQYRRRSPRWVLLACLTPAPRGGQIFLHDAQELEARLTALGLIERLEEHGLRLETGFLDAAHPKKARNSFLSWQQLLHTEDPAVALSRARDAHHEWDHAWFLDDGTLMTRLTLPLRWPRLGDGSTPIRFPRVALDEPAAHNGYRRFLLGDGSALSPEENEALREALLATRQGHRLQAGDLVLFDNARFGHSRDAFEGHRELVVAMGGLLEDGRPCAASVAPLIPRRAEVGGRRHYDPAIDTSGSVSARTFDAGGALDAQTLHRVRGEFDRFGAVHVQQTGLTVPHAGALPDEILTALGFSPSEQFPWGGQHSGRTTRLALSPSLRATDAYPPELWLLPHNEVLYQRDVPARLLFFCPVACEGRTFVHAATLTQRFLQSAGTVGPALLERLQRHGLRIELGFLDAQHPQQPKNYFRSWQDRFGTDDRDEAMRRCQSAVDQFDEAWWLEEQGFSVLMTRFTVPAFHQGLLLFPRIALDAPAAANGFRAYPLGNGEALREEEIDCLLAAFLATREAVSWSDGDLLLVDNLRYGHSRESFTGRRTIGVAMGGRVRVSASAGSAEVRSAAR